MAKSESVKPAFPCSSSGYGPPVQRGMSLRQWYAGQALPAIIASTVASTLAGDSARDEYTTEWIAWRTLEFADTLIAIEGATTEDDIVDRDAIGKLLKEITERRA